MLTEKLLESLKDFVRNKYDSVTEALEGYVSEKIEEINTLHKYETFLFKLVNVQIHYFVDVEVGLTYNVITYCCLCTVTDNFVFILFAFFNKSKTIFC